MLMRRSRRLSMASALARRFYAAFPQRNSPLRLQRAFTPQREGSAKSVFSDEIEIKAKSPISQQELLSQSQQQEQQQQIIEINEGQQGQGQSQGDEQIELFMGKTRILLPNDGLLTQQTKQPPPGHHYHAPRLSIHIPPKRLTQKSWRPQEKKQQHLAEESAKSVMKRIRKEIEKRREMERTPEVEFQDESIEELREDMEDLTLDVQSLSSGAGIGSRHITTTPPNPAPTQPRREFSTSSKDGVGDGVSELVSSEVLSSKTKESPPNNNHPTHQYHDSHNNYGNMHSHIVKTYAEQSFEILSDDPSHHVIRSHVFIKVEEDNKIDECFATASEAIDEPYDDPIRNLP